MPQRDHHWGTMRTPGLEDDRHRQGLQTLPTELEDQVSTPADVVQAAIAYVEQGPPTDNESGSCNDCWSGLDGQPHEPGCEWFALFTAVENLPPEEMLKGAWGT